MELNWEFIRKQQHRLRLSTASDDIVLADNLRQILEWATNQFGFYKVFGLDGFREKLRDLDVITETGDREWELFIKSCDGKTMSLISLDPKGKDLGSTRCVGNIEQVVNEAYNILYHPGLYVTPFNSETTSLYIQAWQDGEFKGSLQIA